MKEEKENEWMLTSEFLSEYCDECGEVERSRGLVEHFLKFFIGRRATWKQIPRGSCVGVTEKHLAVVQTLKSEFLGKGRKLCGIPELLKRF